DSLSQSFAFAQADRAARLEVIHEQGRSFAELQAQYAELQTQYEDLRGKLAEQQSIDQDLNRKLSESEEQRSALELVAAARAEQIRRILAQLRTLQDGLQRIRHSRVYRLMRRLGRWRWLDEIVNKSFNGV